MKKNIFTDQRGIALVMALMISAAIMAMIIGTLILIDRSTEISGTGRVYGTAEEAADGAVNIMKDAVNLAMWGEPMASVFPSAGACSSGSVATLDAAALLDGSVCVTSIDLTGTGLNTRYTATVTLERLYSVIPPGARLEFSRAAGGASSALIFFRITTRVVGPNNTTAENSVLYRFAG